jgi:surface antigen
MTTFHRKLLAVGLVDPALVAPAVATDLRWLNHSPVRFFSAADWDLAREAARRALNKAQDGETVAWTNPDSSHHGSVTPLSTTARDGATCRELKIANHAKRLHGSSVYLFCRQPDGRWAAVQGNAR